MLNMYVSAAILGIAGAAAASAVPHGGPVYPETEVSKAFRLVVNVTDGFTDFHSIHNTYIINLHDGDNNKRDLVGQDKHKHKGLIFYLNGAETDRSNNQVLTESLGDFSSGLSLDFEDGSTTIRTARLVHGGGDDYFSLIHYGEHLPFLRPEPWVACKEKLVHYVTQDKEYIVFKQAVATLDPGSGRYIQHIPQNCARVTLLPECAKFPKNSAPTNKHVIDAHCYRDVKKIDWSKSASD
ncbi:hypothetical protein EsDP_00002791 [Epichloe bromicola]|uniref:DUF7907 domain-containing protein n=1 Tax=Epichloe bromicola TaxID=79588 RepID=A0ABQ0CLU5_9HYPO